MNAIRPKTFADRMTEQADHLHDKAAQTEAAIAEWRKHEGELRGLALSVDPHEPDGCLDCLRIERSASSDSIQCIDCLREYSPNASGCPDCAAESWEDAP